MAEKQSAKDWGQTTALTIEVAQESFAGDGNVLHLDCGGGYMAECVYQNTELYLRGDFTKWKLHLSYTNKPSFSELLFPCGSQPDAARKPVAGTARIACPRL